MSADQRRAALRAFMKERGLNTHSWTKKAKLPESALRGFLAGRTQSMNASSLEKLARAEATSIAEMFGEAIPTRERTSMIKVLSYAVEGGKLAIEYESGGAPVAWKRSWVETYLDGKAENGRIIEVPGDALAEEIRTGDVVCIHLGRTDPARDPGIYCVWDGAAVHLRRVQILPGKMIRMLSDNPRYAQSDVKADAVQIVGRAVWRAGAI